MSEKKTYELTVVDRRCVYLNDHRIAGAKPYVSEYLPQWSFKVSDADLASAIPAIRAKDKAIADLQAALKQIERIAGNLPDDVLCRATGPNDASYRGGLVCTARDIARAALEKSR